MPSSESVLEYLKDQLSEVPDVRFRPMMGEYLLYVRGKLIGGLYDDMLLLKPTAGARSLLPDAPMEKPYGSSSGEGGRGGPEMLFVEDTDDRELLASVVLATADALPEPGKKPRNRKNIPQSNDLENPS
ncbi:MAG: competence protein TfoX [Ruminococcaceae bacterium]|jgi:hypothetical protein|nr:competence protein TfoX [Oscillospiraceae bacterium]